MVDSVLKSDADFIIFGGDFNTNPPDNETAYISMRKVMKNSFEESVANNAKLSEPIKATVGNPRNSYIPHLRPVLFDQLWHKARNQSKIWTLFYDVPVLKTGGNFGKGEVLSKDKEISISDHEAVVVHLLLEK